MAESIIIHFRGQDALQVSQALNKQFGSVGNNTWVFPLPEYLLRVSRYDSYEEEYDADEKAEVEAQLGEAPAVSYDFEIRRSRSDEACDVLELFVKQHLSGMKIAVDDMFRIWSKKELAEAKDFLDIYRHDKIR